MKDRNRTGEKNSRNRFKSAGGSERSDLASEFGRANILHQEGDLGGAANGYRGILLRDPQHVQARHLLGVIELQSGRPGNAVLLIAKAIDVDPVYADAYLDIGAAYMALHRPDEALSSFNRAVELKPRWGLAWSNRGNAFLALKRPEDAYSSYEKALESDPHDPRTHCNLGNVLRELCRGEEALLSYRNSLAIRPNYELALRNCGNLLAELKRPIEALACYERALEMLPHDPHLLVCVGNLQLSLSRENDAIMLFEKALKFDPNLHEALNNLGVSHLQLGNNVAALEAFDRLVEFSPRVAGFLRNRGEALSRLGRFRDAADSYAMVCGISPEFALTLGKLFSAKQMICDWSSFAGLKSSIERGVADGKAICSPFEFLAVADDPAAQSQCAQIYSMRFAMSSTRMLRPTTVPTAKAKIRVAYISGDFGNRPMARLLVGVLEHHDRERFETIGISLRPPDSTEIGQRIVRGLDRFIDVSQQSDDDVRKLLAELDVNIAIDLMGYTDGSRPAIFFNRGAPIQVAYLGFPGTSGSMCMDYILADEFLIPESSRSSYVEKIVYMPDCFQANDDLRQIGSMPTRSQVGLPEAAFVFCSFNNTYKLNPANFVIWCRLLAVRSNAVLWLIKSAPEMETNLRREAAQYGIDADRIIFADRVGYDDHLARQSLADLFLDTLPFNAGTTASDALWSGLPVLTCAGQTFAGRMAGSVLRTAGCQELITYSLEEYEQRALDLSRSGPELKGLRDRLKTVAHRGPLFDTGSFTRHLEAAYGEMWRRHLCGAVPSDIEVRSLSGVVQTRGRTFRT